MPASAHRPDCSKGSEQIFTRSVYGTPRCVVTRGDITVYDYNDVYFEVENATGKVNQIGIQKNTQTCAGTLNSDILKKNRP